MSETFTANEVRRFLADECVDAGGQKAWANRHGLSCAYVHRVIHGHRKPGESIVAALGLRRVVRYVDAQQADREPSDD